LVKKHQPSNETCSGPGGLVQRVGLNSRSPMYEGDVQSSLF